MFIGIDFDNTIVCYDQLFHNLALERNLTPKNLPISKQAVRDHLREIGSEDVWIEMQGLGMARMGPQCLPGAMDLFGSSRNKIFRSPSLATKQNTHGGPPYDMHQAAYDWLNAQGFRSDTSPSRLRLLDLSRGSIRTHKITGLQ